MDDAADLPENYKGLYIETATEKAILVSKEIKSYTEKSCILAEELGHYHTSVGDITDQSKLTNRKQELRARTWSYHKLIPLTSFIDAHHARISGRHEVAEYLGVTEEFLQASIDRYINIHGLFARVDAHHTIVFEPLGVLEMFE